MKVNLFGDAAPHELHITASRVAKIEVEVNALINPCFEIELAQPNLLVVKVYKSEGGLQKLVEVHL